MWSCVDFGVENQWLRSGLFSLNAFYVFESTCLGISRYLGLGPGVCSKTISAFPVLVLDAVARPLVAVNLTRVWPRLDNLRDCTSQPFARNRLLRVGLAESNDETASTELSSVLPGISELL